MPFPARLVATITAATVAASATTQVHVVSTDPVAGVCNAAIATTIRIDFDAPVARRSVSAATSHVFGRWSGTAPGSWLFSNGDATLTFVPSRPFFPGEVVSVALSAAVSAAGGGALGNGFAFSFWTGSAAGTGIYLHTATLSVRRNGETRPIRTYGAYAGDLDGNGAPDLTLPNEDVDDVRVMLGNRCGGFIRPVVYGLPAGSVPSPIEGADFNGDGIIDVAIANTRGNSVSILLGNGDGTLLPATTYPVGQNARGLAVLDAEADGDVDLVVAHRVGDDLALLRNRGDGTILPPVHFEGGGSQETAVAAADANGDGVLDLFVGNFGSQTVTLLLGDGVGGYTLSATAAVQGRPWMIAVGDIDGDGAVDAVVCNSTTNSVSIVRGTGTGGLRPATHYPVGQFPLAVDLGDIDGDGDLDLTASNFASATFTVFRNDGRGNMTSTSILTTTAAGSCMLLVDFDRDGDIDLLGIDELDDVVQLYEQVDSVPAGVNPPSCTAQLRIDNMARSAGFGMTPAYPAPAGSTLFIGVSGKPLRGHLLLIGTPLTPGALTAYGFVNVGAASVIPTFFRADSHGETLLPLTIPPGLPLGVQVTFQAVLPGSDAQAVTLSNPETVVTR